MASAEAWQSQPGTGEATVIRRNNFVLIEGGASSREAPVKRSVGFLEVALASVAIALVIVCSSLASTHAAEVRQATALEAASSVSYVVHPGDTIWSIAEANPVEGLSTVELVSYIRTSNQLSSALLVPGQSLEIPRSTVG